MCPILFPDLSVLLGEKVVDDNHVNVIEGEVIELHDILELINESRGISNIRPKSLLYLREFT